MSGNAADDQTEPIIPRPEQRLAVVTFDGIHPSLLSPDELLQQCDSRFQRRSGPGGQHRNKTSSGVFLYHEPSKLVGEATERRSQADNRAVALIRLRYRMAVELRTQSVIDMPETRRLADAEQQIRNTFRGKTLKLNENNPNKPPVLALVLNDMHAAGGQPSVLAEIWKSSTSSLVNLIRSHPPAFTLVNAIRRHHERGPLK